ncbi:uncharacterized protein LOC131293186 [Anopheles ziemanni]|uniref:uncharacterized protein LOC131264092 n=1 Tax=Anopheles coustani TaxID=139045 RepID=UPI0026587CB8|nr:uncharacterized protein LOC131264092 [Anopheles coustani]XP_058177248.1 uncharacterized protein LOC131293186 [Anopheles ziemanni]
MKVTIVVAISLATLASLCTASPLLVTKHVVKKLVARHMEPPVSETVVVYTPVQPYHHQVVSPVVPHHQHLPMVQPFHAKFLPDLGSLMKHPWLKNPLLNLLPKRPSGGVVEVHHQETVVPSAPYPPAVHELPKDPEPEYVPVPVEPTPAPEYVAPVVVTPAPVVPAPVYGLPAPVYGPPETTGMEFSSSSSSSSSMNVAEPTVTGAKYVAVNPGARHEAPLPGHTQSVVFENLEPAAGTEGLTLLPPVVQTDQRSLFNPLEAEIYQLAPDYLRSAVDEGDGPRDAVEKEARYIAINGDLRHEAPLPGYDHSIVIENLDTV